MEQSDQNNLKRTKTRKIATIFGVSLGVILVFGIIGRFAGWFDGGGDLKQVETDTSERRTVIELVSASGRIQPEQEVIIRPDVSGEIIDLRVKEGDYVRQNEILLRIKPDIYQARIDELNASLLTQKSRLEQAKASMLQAEVEYLKQKELYDKQLVSELEYLQRKSNYEGQKANVRAAEYQIQSADASLRRAKEELAQTVIRAPKDGTITRLSVEQGERVLGNSQMAGTEMMRIARMDQMEILVDVNENDIVNVSVGDSTAIEVDSYQNRVFSGVVTEIANSAEVTGFGSAEQVTNYKVKVRVTTPHNLDATGTMYASEQLQEQVIPEDSPEFKPGMSATVDIQTQIAYDVVTVPIQAVTVRDFAKDGQERGTGRGAAKDRGRGGEAQGTDQGGEASQSTSTGSAGSADAPKEDFRRVVFVVSADSVQRVEVKTGISDNSHIQILSGIDEGVEVVIGSYRTLTRELNDGDKVEIQSEEPTRGGRD